MTRLRHPSGLHHAWLAVHAVILVAGFGALVSAPFQATSLPLQGQPAPATIRATSRVTFIDVAATNRLKLRVGSEVPVVYVRSLTAADSNRALADRVLGGVMRVWRRHGLSWSRRQAGINHLLQGGGVITDGLPSLTRPQWTLARYWTLKLLDESLGFPAFDLAQKLHVNLTLVSSLPDSLAANTTQVIRDLVDTFLTPTLSPDPTATTRRRQQAEARVRPVTVTVSPGEVIIRRGQVVTASVLQELQAVGLPTSSADWHQRVSSIVFVAVIVVLLLWYLRAFHPATTGNQRLMLLVDAAILATAFVAKLAIPGHVLLPFFFPVAGATALVGLLLSAEVGVSLAVVLGLLVGWVVGGSFELAAYYLLTGVCGALAIRQIRRLNDFVLAGAYIALTAAAVIAAFQLLAGSYDLMGIRNYAAAATFNGVASGTLAFGGFVVLGGLFGVTTSFILLELGNPEQRLLRRLMAEAPGTYNHSLVVASMVERAAREIGADVLLARVMALYHDIGKVANPLCFVENQIGTTNIHDDLPPAESAEILRAHVNHGLQLARQSHLPQPIRDAIVQHHGTMTMPFFFHRALQVDPSVDAAVFSYAGPKPESKECGLLMLADGCESAVRAAGEKTPEKIRNTVERIISERISGDQLSSCRLTLSDLDVVRQAFVEVLNSIYHPRVEYPVGFTPTSRGADEAVR